MPNDPETPTVEGPQDATTDPKDTTTEPDENADTFPRAYVENLRRENASYRERAKTADDLAKRLHASLVERDGRLADPSDLPFDAAHLDDDASLSAAIEALVSSKPHLASRRPRGDVGQGFRPGPAAKPSLGAMLRSAV